MSIYDQYETVIGLEIHVQLSTLSKAFCGDSTQFGGAPNTQVSAISLGHPGTLPRLNKQQVEFAIRLGLALGCEINRHNYFDRKNYFYADLPKGYQITQDNAPICLGGKLRIQTDEGERVVRIHHIHMEEDAGKSIHDQRPNHSLIDLNRAGVPLLEIVTEPDLRTAAEVDALMMSMRQLVRYLGISDGNMEQGSMRCDCNVSVRKKGVEVLGERCEIKNLNSMRFARRAIEFERKRQIDRIEAGYSIQQQTLNFDPNTGITTPLRSKEDAHDYRYFPEPDLAPIFLTDTHIDQIRHKLPALPWQVVEQMTQEYQLSDYDARILSEEASSAQYFLRLAKLSAPPKPLANLLINKLLPYLQEQQLSPEDCPLSDASILDFLQLIETKKVSHSAAYQGLLPSLFADPKTSPTSLAESLNLLQTDDEDSLGKIVEAVVHQFPDKVKAYQKGKKGLLGFFMGQIMRQSKGKANPQIAQTLLAQKLEESS